jgi:hypothetical protein
MLKLNDWQMQALMAAERASQPLRSAFLSRINNSTYGQPINDAVLHAAIANAARAMVPRVRGTPTLFALGEGRVRNKQGRSNDKGR